MWYIMRKQPYINRVGLTYMQIDDKHTQIKYRKPLYLKWLFHYAFSKKDRTPICIKMLKNHYSGTREIAIGLGITYHYEYIHNVLCN